MSFNKSTMLVIDYLMGRGGYVTKYVTDTCITLIVAEQAKKDMLNDIMLKGWKFDVLTMPDDVVKISVYYPTN